MRQFAFTTTQDGGYTRTLTASLLVLVVVVCVTAVVAGRSSARVRSRK
jgi:hypothetical protein